MSLEILTAQSIQRRHHWIDEIAKISGRFGDDSSRIDRELISEIQQDGLAALLDHLRLCGSIPEHYGHDSSEEKLYSKYTDSLLAMAFIGTALTVVID
jgi:type II restriction enzyme